MTRDDLNLALWIEEAKDYKNVCDNLFQRGRNICAGILSRYINGIAFWINNENNSDKVPIILIDKNFLDIPVSCKVSEIWYDMEDDKIKANVIPVEGNVNDGFVCCLDNEKWVDWSLIIPHII